MSGTSSTAFPLGVFVGNPNPGDPAAEAAFESAYNQFTAVMGVQPTYMDAYVDSTQSVSQWASNVSWTASAYAASPVTKSVTPVIGLPMSSTAAGSPSTDQMFKNFAAGDYDSILQSMVKSWADAGYLTQYWRPGVEMNLTDSPSYAGTDAATQADWVAAFQHINTVLHAAAAADGVKLQVVWNPGVGNDSDVGNATQTVYPGNQYVDVIGADVYGEIYPYGNRAALYDWDKSGQVINSNAPVYDSSIQQWAADPENLTHYYTYPASDQYALDGSGGTDLSLQNLIDFAKAEGKPIAIPETGAGNTADGAGVSDNPTFVKWLASTLTNAGVDVDFVNVWDSNGGGSYEFSQASDGKPLEAAAWADYFGAQSGSAATSGSTTTTSTGTTTTGSGSSVVSSDATVLGSGADTVALGISEDAYEGNAQFTVSVDGVQIGGDQTVTASHALGQSQVFDVDGNFGAGTHVVAVDFLNDAYGGGPTTDRNLYVTSASYDGGATTDPNLGLFSNGTQSLFVSSDTDGEATPLVAAADSQSNVYNPGDAGGTITTGTGDIVNVGTGAVTVHASGAAVTVFGGQGPLTFIGGSGSDVVVAGSGSVFINAGNDTLDFTAGTGKATIDAGSGLEDFNIINGKAGGLLVISHYDPSLDSIQLQGYAAGTATQTVENGSTYITLTDHTQIMLSNMSLTHPLFT